MEDTMIIKLFYARSEQAISELATKYGRLLGSIAYNILHNEEDADECENDTYLQTWNSIPPKKPDVLMAFVCRITRNLALNKLKYNNRKKRNAGMEVLFSELEECIPGTEGVEAAADDVISDVIDEFLRQLDDQTRILFIRRYFYMESAKSLAIRYGLSASNVSTRLNRVRNRLRECLEEEGIAL